LRAKRAEEEAFSAVAFHSQHTHERARATQGTNPHRDDHGRLRRHGRAEFGIRLQERSRQELRERPDLLVVLAAIFPIRFEARNPGIRRQQGHLMRGFAESGGRVLLNHGEKTAEVGKEHSEIERISYFGCRRAACFHSTRRGDAGTEGFLKSRDVFVEIQKLGGERVFGG